ncbi:hypothetical protein TWF506_002898 [Arthrobotrys conoides]|uniref:Uncharacterized protein n=1 Tax=Arthrobotrys conoides TaxID=74498 RepID=A0AAN8RR80_9PEZI
MIVYPYNHVSSMLKARKPRYVYFVLLVFLFAPGGPATYLPTTAQSSTNITRETTGTRPKTDVPVTTGPPFDLGRTDLGTTTPPNLNLTVAIGTPDSHDFHEGPKLSDGRDIKRVQPDEMLQVQLRVFCGDPRDVLSMNPDPATYPRFLDSKRGDFIPILSSRPNFQQQIASGFRSVGALREYIRRMLNNCRRCRCDPTTSMIISRPRVPGSRGGGCPSGDQFPEICMSWYGCRCNAVVSESRALAALAPRPLNSPELIQNPVGPIGMEDAVPDPLQLLTDAVNMAVAAEILTGDMNPEEPPLYGPDEPDYKYHGPPGGYFDGGYNPYGGGGTGSGSGSGLGLKKKSEIQPPSNVDEMEESRSRVPN